MRRRNRRAGSAMALVIVGSLGWTWYGAMGAAPEIGRYPQQVAMASETAQRIREEYLQIANDMEPFDGFVKDDLSKAKDVFEAVAATCDRAADAWRRNDDAQGNESWAQVGQSNLAKDAWYRRLMHFRRAQIECAPTEQWYCGELRGVRLGALPALHAWVAARKAAADAWGAVAEATVAGADPKQLAKIDDQATALRAAVEIAQWRYGWAKRIEEWSQNGRLNGDDVKPQLEALLKAQDERAKVQEDRFEQERRTRDASLDADAHIAQAERDLSAAYNVAARKRERAGR